MTSYPGTLKTGLTLRLFGNPELKFCGKPIEIKRKKVRALLYYIAAQERPVSREKLIDVLWPMQEPKLAQHNLSSSLYALKKVLPDAVVTQHSGVGLRSGIEVDVRVFSEYCGNMDTESAQRAISLYQGAFMEGFTVSDSECFGQWQTSCDAQYLNMALNASSFAAETLIHAGSYARAIEILTHAIELDPLREDLYRLAMQAHRLNGNRPGASRTYQCLLRVLDEALGIPPMPETINLYTSIILQDTYPQKPIPHNARSETAPAPKTWQLHTELPFAGREQEMQELDHLSDEYFVVLMGSAGIGRTRLCQEFSRRKGRRLVRVACKEFEQSIPYFPFVKALRNLTYEADWNAPLLRSKLLPLWWNALCTLVPELDPETKTMPPAYEEPYTFWEAIYQFLLALNRISPLVLLLDDMHWADYSTLALLQYIVCQDNGERFAIIGTQRTYCASEPLNKVLDSIDREGKLHIIEIPLLRTQDISVIISHYWGAGADQLTDRLDQVSAGNPSVLAAITRSLIQSEYKGGNKLPSSQELLASAKIQNAARSYYCATVDRLQTNERRFLEAAAVIGTTFDIPIILPVALLDEIPAQEALNVLLSKGTIQVKEDGRYGFGQLMLREFIYERLGGKARAYHLRVARELESGWQKNPKANASILAFHYKNSTQPEKCMPYAVIAGDYASHLGSCAEAIDCYKLAAEYLDGIELLSVMESLASKYVKNGQREKAVQAFTLASKIADRDGYPDLVEFFSASAIITSWSDFEELVWGIVPQYRHMPDPTLSKHYDAAESFGVSHARDGYFAMRIKISRALYLLCVRELASAIRCYQEFLEMARQSGSARNNLSLILYAKMQIASCMLVIGNHAASDYIEDGYAQARDVNAIEYIPPFIVLKNALLQRQNQFDEADSLLAQAQDLAVKMRNTYVCCEIQIQMANNLIRRGETESARSMLREARDLAQRISARHLWVQAWRGLLPLIEDPGTEPGREDLLDFAASVGDTELADTIRALSIRS